MLRFFPIRLFGSLKARLSLSREGRVGPKAGDRRKSGHDSAGKVTESESETGEKQEGKRREREKRESGKKEIGEEEEEEEVKVS